MDKVTLNNKEQKRLIVLNEVLAGRLTGSAAVWPFITAWMAVWPSFTRNRFWVSSNLLS